VRKRRGRSQPIWIEQRDALAIHERLAALEGTTASLRDSGLLDSALARPRQLYAYGKKPGVIELSAAYLFGIVRNHPFVDGNKRVGFVVAMLFLELNGYAFTAAEEDAAQAVMAVAGGSLDEPGLITWLRANSQKR
jgi:death on curing protein